MAWRFSLSVECAQELEAQYIKQRFCEVGQVSLESIDFQFYPLVFPDEPDNSSYWCSIFFDIQNSSSEERDIPDVMSKLGFLMYELLKGMNLVFRYALFGLEVDEFRTYSELLQSSKNEIVQFKGLVISESLYHQYFNDISEFVSFKAQYLWIPYEGEVDQN